MNKALQTSESIRYMLEVLLCVQQGDNSMVLTSDVQEE